MECGAQNLAGTESPFRKVLCKDLYDYGAQLNYGRANALGLRNVVGNLWEWTSDCWTSHHFARQGLADSEVPRPGDCRNKVVKGGSFDDGPENLNAAARQPLPRDRRQENVGFRLVRELD